MSFIRLSTITSFCWLFSCVVLIRGIFRYQVPFATWYLLHASESFQPITASNSTPFFPKEQFGKAVTSSPEPRLDAAIVPNVETFINITRIRKSSIPSEALNSSAGSITKHVQKSNRPRPTKPKFNVSRTKIVALSDYKYMELALKWYHRLHRLGYTEHLLVATDDQAATYFHQHGVRYDSLLPRNNSFSFSDCDKDLKLGKRNQNYRRHVFSSRWNFIWRLLQNGTNVLLSDVDTIFNRYLPLQSLEDTNIDHFIGYEGGVPSFPKTKFYQKGFTINGGMHWLRASSEGVLEFVRTVVDRCGCLELSCNCLCDDQWVLNDVIFEGNYTIIWEENNVNSHNSSRNAIPRNWSEVSWEGRTGVCTKTRHRVQIWDRHTVYRGPLGDSVPCPKANWFSMPQGVDKENLHEVWDRTCGQNSTGIV